MSFHRPHRVTPIQSGRIYRARARRRSKSSIVRVLGVAALVGAGAGALAANDGDLTPVKEWAVSTGMMRENRPQLGAHFRNCDAARTAGVAPIYRGESGYRAPLDADLDGVACEPYPR